MVVQVFDMRAIVIYYTRFGNTERIAKSLERGLKESGIEDVVCINERDAIAVIDSLKQFDLICIGSPTEGFTAPKRLKEFLETIKGRDLSSKYGFAFDTRVNSRLSGSAAKLIEKELTSKGLRIVAPRKSAIVFTLKEMGSISGARLKEGEEKEFEQIGFQIGTAVIQSGNKPEAHG